MLNCMSLKASKKVLLHIYSKFIISYFKKVNIVLQL